MIKFIKILLVVIFGIIYIPLNLVLQKLQKWYQPMFKKDKVIYFAFAPFFWLLVLIVTLVSYPYEKIGESLH